MSKPPDLVQGTLDLLLLKILALEPMNGHAISLRLKQVSGERAPGQRRLTLSRAAQARTGRAGSRRRGRRRQNNRRAKFYSVSARGRRQLEKERKSWDRLSAAITHVVSLTRT